MHDIQKTLSENIKQYRRNKGIQQSELAEITSIGQANLSRIENGKIEPGILSVQKIADGLGIPIAQLLTDTKSNDATVFEKVLQIESLDEYDQKLLEALIDTFLEKNRLAGMQDYKMKKRLEELERVRNKS